MFAGAMAAMSARETRMMLLAGASSSIRNSGMQSKDDGRPPSKQTSRQGTTSCCHHITLDAIGEANITRSARCQTLLCAPTGRRDPSGVSRRCEVAHSPCRPSQSWPCGRPCLWVNTKDSLERRLSTDSIITMAHASDDGITSSGDDQTTIKISLLETYQPRSAHGGRERACDQRRYPMAFPFFFCTETTRKEAHNVKR